MKNNKSKRAFTLVELTIVLSVVAILSALVTSFTVLTQKNTEVSTKQLDALNEIQIVEAIVEKYLESETENITIDFVPGTLSVGEQTLSLSRIETFDWQDKGGFYIFKITYNEGKIYTFCVDPYINDAVGGNSQ